MEENTTFKKKMIITFQGKMLGRNYCTVSVNLPISPEGQTKTKLGNTEVRGLADQAVSENLTISRGKPQYRKGHYE